VNLEELVPGLLAALRSGIEAVLTHDVGYKLIGDFLRRQLAEFAPDPCVAPAGILSGQLDDQLADVESPAPPWPTRLLAGFFLPEPARKGGWRHDGDEVLDGAPQGFAQADEPPPFVGCENDPLREPAPQLLVLGLGELKLPGLVFELPSHDRV